MMHRILYFLLTLSFFYTNINAQFEIIKISDEFNPNEPSIIISPLDTNIMVAGSNIFNQYYSHDGGYNWQRNTLTSPYGVWGDPTITVDTAGNFYFLHLSNPANGNWIDRIVAQKSEDNGVTWTSGTYMGLNGTKAQDKQWPIVNQQNNNIYVTWTEFDAYGSTNAEDKSRIKFSYSDDEGETWSEAIKINEVDGNCIDSDDTVEGAVPAIGPNGEIYVAWAGPEGLVFDRSFDGGTTWLDQDIHVNEFVGGWDFEIEGISRANGLPVTVCDLSPTSTNGTIYINWADHSNGETNTDIWMVKSTDQGDTWSTPKRINDDTGDKEQFFTWMTIDQTTGYLYTVFYDRRNYDDTNTDVYLAYSTDGGENFTNVKISDESFVPNPDIFFGDYNNISVVNGCVRPVWTRLHQGNLSLHTAIIHHEQLLVTQNNLVETTPDLKVKVFPNPMQDTAYISFKLHEESTIDVKLFDDNGRLINVVLQNEIFPFGKHIIKLPHEHISKLKGVYNMTVYINKTKLKSQKVIIK